MLNSKIWHPFAPLLEEELEVVSAKDALIYTADGKTLIDAISSWWLNLHGHSNSEISNAIKEQLESFQQVIFSGFTHKPAKELTEGLAQLIPVEYQRCFFSDDGSTAVEAAIKLALQYWEKKSESRTKLIALSGAYHGDTVGAMSLAERSVYNKSFVDLLFDVERIDAPIVNSNSLNQLKEILAKTKPAAFIYEPLIQGAGGMLMQDPEILESLLELCQANNVLLIADEVLTAFYRTGTFLASEQIKTKPDIICISKAITGGALPLGLTLVRENIIKYFLSADRSEMFFHGHSYTGNALACAAAVKNLELIKTSKFKQELNNLLELQKKYFKILSKNPKLQNVRHCGMIVACDFLVKDSGYLSTIRNKIYNAMIERGVLIRPMGNVIYVLPPVCITEKQLEQVYSAISEVAEEL